MDIQLQYKHITYIQVHSVYSDNIGVIPVLALLLSQWSIPQQLNIHVHILENDALLEKGLGIGWNDQAYTYM